MNLDTALKQKAEGAVKKLKKTTLAKRQLFLNYKGGTGKTSIAAAYGYYLALKGKRVLMVDLDAQGHLTTCLNQDVIKHDRSLYSVIVKDERLSDIIVPASLATLSLVPSSIALSALELPMMRMPLREYQLRKALATVRADYDFIVMDSAPNINLLGLNAILASDEIVIPMLADFLSFHGLKILLETLASIERDFKFYLGRVHILLNRYNPDYLICAESKEAMQKFYPQYSLKTIINESHEIIDASSLGRSIFELYPESRAARDIRDLVKEVNGI